MKKIFNNIFTQTFCRILLVIFILSIISLLLQSCCKKEQCIIPECKPKIVYKKVYIPTYVNPLDNITLQKPSKLSLFEFNEKGDICLTDDNFKILLKDLFILKKEREYYFKMLDEIKNQNY